MIEDMGEYGRGSVPPVPPPGEERPSTHAARRAAWPRESASHWWSVRAASLSPAPAVRRAVLRAPRRRPPRAHRPPDPKRRKPPVTSAAAGGSAAPAASAFGGDVLHGTYVVAKSGGGYQTIQTQNGTVSAVSSTSLSVKSADGYSFTYVVKAGTIVDAQSAGIGSVKKGDTVTVNATVSGSTATIDRVMDVTLLQKSLPNLKGGYGVPGGPGGKFRGPRTAPSPTTTPGATT